MLSKNGWGFSEFIIWGAVLLFALIVTIFFVIRLYSGLPSLNSVMESTIDYETIEETIENKSLQYIREHYTQEITTGVIVVSTKQLLNLHLIEPKDLTTTTTDDLCNGYALIRKEEGALTSKPYITCDEYSTEGYQSWRVNNNE